MYLWGFRGPLYIIIWVLVACSCMRAHVHTHTHTPLDPIIWFSILWELYFLLPRPWGLSHLGGQWLCGHTWLLIHPLSTKRFDPEPFWVLAPEHLLVSVQSAMSRAGPAPTRRPPPSPQRESLATRTSCKASLSWFLNPKGEGPWGASGFSLSGWQLLR